MSLAATDGEVFLDNYYTDSLYFILTGDVKFREGSTFGVAERVDGFNDDKRIVLTGYPRVFQNENNIRGSKITVRHNNMFIEVDDVKADVLLEDR